MKYKAGDRVLLAECSEEEFGVYSPEQEATILEACEDYDMYIVEVEPEDAHDDGLRECDEFQIIKLLIDMPTPEGLLR